MHSRPVARRRHLVTVIRALPSMICRRSLMHQKARPVLPFLVIPRTTPSVARSFTSVKKQWLKHEAKLFVRYSVSLWGTLLAILAVLYVYGEEEAEKEHLTPPEWFYFTRKYLRDAHRFSERDSGEFSWSKALETVRIAISRLEDPKYEGEGLIRLSDGNKPLSQFIAEFAPYDVSAKSDEWQRGYYDALMLAARAAEHTDGWVRDRTRNFICPPQFVIGPSNLRPVPLPPGNLSAPREEDCDIAYPSADHWYIKILATKGFTPRQRIDAALEYSYFMEFKHRWREAETLHDLALAEATQGIKPSKRPYDPKTLVLKNSTQPASMNVLDTLTVIANFKARRGDLSSALPIYTSILKNRRSLSDNRPRGIPLTSNETSFYRQLANYFGPPGYPPTPLDGFQPPWRSPYERCQEASLHLYIGEILFATRSPTEGLAWTRDGVDMAEEQLRAEKKKGKDKEMTRICRECLATGLDNWSAMVSRLAKAEEEKAARRAKPNVFSLWSGTQDAEARWVAETAVVQERTRRAEDLLESMKPPAPSLFCLILRSMRAHDRWREEQA